MLCIHNLPRWMLSDGDAKSSPSKETACYDRYNLQKVCHPAAKPYKRRNQYKEAALNA